MEMLKSLLTDAAWSETSESHSTTIGVFFVSTALLIRTLQGETQL